MNEPEAIRMSAGQHTRSDFPLILAGALGEVVARRYEQRKPDLLRPSREIPRSDYRAGNATALSATPKPFLVPEGGEVKYTTITETGAPLPVLEDYAAIYAASNKLLTDDAAANNHFADIARRMTEGAVELTRDILVAPLLANGGLGQTMPDGKTLFHADHGNLAATGSALNVTSLSLAQTSMRRIRGAGGELLAVTPAYLIVPPEQEVAALQLMATIAAATVADTNPFSNKLEVIVEPALTSTTGWYLAGDPATFDGLVHAYLNGQATPTVDSRAGWNTLGFEWRLVWALAASFIDYRAWYFNSGA